MDIGQVIIRQVGGYDSYRMFFEIVSEDFTPEETVPTQSRGESDSSHVARRRLAGNHLLHLDCSAR
jgi:hypothetical protein